MMVMRSEETIKRNPWRRIQLRMNVMNLKQKVRKLGLVHLEFGNFFTKIGVKDGKKKGYMKCMWTRVCNW